MIEAFKQKFSNPDTKELRIFISNINSMLGHALVELFRNDYLNDESYHLFIGTLDQTEKNAIPNGVTKIIDSSNIVTLTKVILDCDIIIYDLLRCPIDEVEFVIKILKFSNYIDEKILICVSSVMTWAQAIPKNEPYNEHDLLLRRTLPKYQFLLNVEDQCMQANAFKTNLKSYVLNSGVLYGHGEDIFFNFFKQAWLLDPYELQFFSDGKNIIPTIHVQDLANYIFHIVHRIPDDKYIFAVDFAEGQDQKSIVAEISKAFGSGLVKPKPTMESVLDENFEIIRINLKIKPNNLFENLNNLSNTEGNNEKNENNNNTFSVSEQQNNEEILFNWWCKEGFIKNIGKVCEEFIIYRGLKTNKVMILGPPAVGKTYYGKIISKIYNIPHILIQEVIEQILKSDSDLGNDVRRVLKELKDKMIEEEQAKIDLEKKKNKNKKGWVEPILDTDKLNPRVPDQLLVKIYRWRLSLNDCKFRGYILDGFPKNFDEIYALFVKNGEKIIYSEEAIRERQLHEKKPPKIIKPSDETEIKKPVQLDLNEEILPQTVIFLQGNDEYLRERCKNIPENIKHGSHYNEEGMIRRLYNYKKLNEEGGHSVLDFIKENKFEFCELNVEKNDDLNSEIKKFIERNGSFKTYSSKEREYELEKEKELAEEKEKNIQLEITKQKENEEKLEKERIENQLKQEEKKIEELRIAENNILDVRSQPLRQYLADRVIPHITEGLIQICRTSPENPVEFLADFLVKKSEEIELEMQKELMKKKNEEQI